MHLLHLSDLHLSRYGESGAWTTLEDDDEDEVWTTLHTWQRWQVQGCRDRKGRPDKLRLVDPEGVIHKVKSWPSRKEEKVIGHLLDLGMERHQTSSEQLVKHRPDPQDLDALLAVDSQNSNLRFLKVVDQVEAMGPDLVLITGDITDNGFGYGLVCHYLAPWVESGRLFSVPGNHDTYDMFPYGGRARRAAAKEERYSRFADAIGLHPGQSGAYLRRVEDIAVVGINSCRMPLTPLSASGEVSREQMAWLSALSSHPEHSGARLRIGLVHHHLLRMPFVVGRRSPLEVGMRLRNASEAIQAFTEAGLDMVFNGHRHHGYVVKLPGRPTIISSPSSTLGCKSNSTVYLWRMDLAEDDPFPKVHHVPMESFH